MESYLSLFSSVDSSRIEDGELVLSSDDQDVLRYAPWNLAARELVDRLSSAPD